MKPKLRFGLFGRTWLVVAGLLLAYGLIMADFPTSTLAQTERYYLSGQLNDTAELVKQMLVANKPWQPDRADTLIINLGKGLNKRLILLDSAGKVMADSYTKLDSTINLASLPEVASARLNGSGLNLYGSFGPDSNAVSMALPLYKHPSSPVLRVSAQVGRLGLLSRALRRDVFAMTIWMLLVSILPVWLLVKSITNPLNQIRQTIWDMADGNLTPNLAINQANELGWLAQAVSSMGFEIKEHVVEISRQRETLKAIISSLNEGLCVVDAEQTILATSHAFCNYFNCHKPIGKAFWEIIRDQKAREFLRGVIEKQQDDKVTLDIANNTYICSASIIAHHQRIVLVFYDLTELKNAEKLKREFVSNVSHELKTPLTSIKGFVEILKEELTEDQHKHYLNIIERNSERLILIVKDLLSLTQLETSTNTKGHPVAMPLVLDNMRALFDTKVSMKNLRLLIDCPKNLPPVLADEERLEQVLVNLIQNALQYTEQGSITVSCTQVGNTVQTTVSDTGVGIPGQHLPNLFERFYVVDKSRSKKYGGTGLGLSICKQIVENYQGSISVQSRVGAGTTFTFVLPLAED